MLKTKLFTTEQLAEAAEILKNGGLVAMPTETVYGLGANALDESAVKKIYKAKGRESDNPLIVHISDIEQWQSLVKNIPDNALKLAEHFWPGALTIILEKKPVVPFVTSGGLDTVAVRMPSDKTAREFIRLCGVPVAAPSANISGAPSPTSFSSVLADMDGKIDGIIDGGNCKWGVESTVVSLVGDKPVLLRPGAVTLEMLEEAVGEVAVDKGVTHEIDISQKAASPGMKYKHYSPEAKVYIVNTDDRDKFTAFVNLKNFEKSVAMCYSSWQGGIEIDSISFGEEFDASTQSQVLFENLRECDKMGAEYVYVPMPNPKGMGLAVLNRLLRAAAFDVIDIDGGEFEVIGITGGTGAGKSTVSKRYFGSGNLVIDCDRVAHDILDESSVLSKVCNKFGDVCKSGGKADRKAIGHIAFSSPEKLKELTDITFPHIVACIMEYVRKAKQAGYRRVVLDAPTLIESGLSDICDKIIFVRADRNIRLKRITERDGLSAEEAADRLNSGKDDEFYLKYADEIIDNNQCLV